VTGGNRRPSSPEKILTLVWGQNQCAPEALWRAGARKHQPFNFEIRIADFGILFSQPAVRIRQSSFRQDGLKLKMEVIETVPKKTDYPLNSSA